MMGNGTRESLGPRLRATISWKRAYAATSAAVGLALILAITRADYLVGLTVGRECGDSWDAVRWSLMIQSCGPLDLNHFDVANGGAAVLVVLAALTPTLLVLRVMLLTAALMYMSDAGQMHTTFVATGHIYPGIELWWLPIFWLSVSIIVAAAVVAASGQVRRWFHSRGAG